MNDKDKRQQSEGPSNGKTKDESSFESLEEMYCQRAPSSKDQSQQSAGGATPDPKPSSMNQNADDNAAKFHRPWTDVPHVRRIEQSNEASLGRLNARLDKNFKPTSSSKK